jgi:signal transduction histidine kinase
MFFRKISLIAALLWVICANAQQDDKRLRSIDSLLRVLPTLPDTAKALRLNTISYRYQPVDPKLGMKYANQALALSKKIKYSEGIAEAYRMIGYNYSVDSNEKALEYYFKALKIAKTDRLKTNLYMGMGLVYTYKGDYKSAMKYDLMALKLAEDTHDDRLAVGIAMNIGIIYYDMANYPKALEYYVKSLQWNKKLGRKTGEAYCYGNIGNVYSSMGKLREAIENYNKAATISIELGDVASEAMSYTAIGEIYFQQKKYDDAIAYIEKSLVLSRKVNDLRNVAYASAVLGDTQMAMAKLPEYAGQKKVLLERAIANFNASSDIQKGQQSLKEIYANYEQLALAYQLLGNYEKAFELGQLSIKYKDSIYNQDTKETVKNLEDKREIELRDKQIKLNKITLESNERQRWLYISGIAFLLIIAGLVLLQSRSRKKTNQKLELLNAELDQANKVKLRFFSILNHDLRSPVSRLISFLHLQKESPELLDEESKQRMETKTITSAENLLDTMEDLLLWSKGQMENFKPQPAKIPVSAVFTDLEKHFSSADVTLNFENSDALVLFTDENYVKTILRNLIGNAVKALRHTQNPTVVVKAFSKNGTSYISVIDNGPGGTQEKFRALYDEKEVVGIQTGLGLHLIRDLAKAINCQIAVDTQPEKGTTFTLSFA